MAKPSDEYIAGFFDGEGCVTISRGQLIPIVRVGIGQKKLRILELVLERFPNGHIHSASSKARFRPDSIYYQLQYSGTKALPLLEAIHPYLVDKRRQAWLAMRLIGFSRPRGFNERIPDKERALRLKIADMIQGANHA